VLFDRDVDYIANFMAAQNTLNRARLEKYQLAETAANYKLQSEATSNELTAYKAQTAAFKDQIAAQSDKLRTQAAAYEVQSADFKTQIAAYEDQSQAFVQQLRDQTNAHLAQTTEYERRITERDQRLSEGNAREAKLAEDLGVAREQALQHAVQRDDARMAYHHLYIRRSAELSSPRFLVKQIFIAVKQRITSRWRKLVARPPASAQVTDTLQSLAQLMALQPTTAATQTPLTCSLVIPTKNGGDRFKQVVAGLQRQSIWPMVEFIIVDSGSTDDTIETARLAGAKCIAIPPAEFNHGATRDYAISLTSCERVVLTVQDAIPYDQFMIERLVRTLDDDEVVGAYARQIPQPDADPITKRNLNSWLTGRREQSISMIESENAFNAMTPMERYLASNFDNVCSIIRKSTWAEDHFGRVNFGEDIDWGRRALLRGHKIAYEPRATVVHSHDRPISYEYKRTYVCHRKLYELFGLQTVPSLRRAVRGWLSVLAADCMCVLKSDDRFFTKLRLLVKLPALTAMQILGQYQGAKDFIAGTQKKITGV
jgi:rhamnosyltransferase